MKNQELQFRNKQFALSIIKLVAHLANNRVGWTFTNQIVRSANQLPQIIEPYAGPKAIKTLSTNGNNVHLSYPKLVFRIQSPPVHLNKCGAGLRHCRLGLDGKAIFGLESADFRRFSASNYHYREETSTVY
ncbi:MAG: hypothetical protein WD398_16215 [Cyclobacteriaceae bacterium]